MGQAWLFASGKGGVGKSTLCAGIGCALANAGRSVAVLDAAIGLRNQDMLLQMSDRVVYDLYDVVQKSCALEDALISHYQYPTLCLLPAVQFQSAQSISPKEMRKLTGALRARFDFVLVDGPSGVDRGFLNALDPADEVLLVTTPDDLCLRDAERAASVVIKQKSIYPRLIVNQLMPDLIRAGEMYTPQVAAQTLDLSLFGAVPYDLSVYRGLLNGTGATALTGDVQSALQRIAQRIQGREVPLPQFKTQPGLMDRIRRKKGDQSP